MRRESSVGVWKVSRSSRKGVDVVLVAVRYVPGYQRVWLAKGYERRGAIWSDIRLFDRQALLNILRAGTRVASGRPHDVPGDFETFAPIKLRGNHGDANIYASGRPSWGDELGMPLF